MHHARRFFATALTVVLLLQVAICANAATNRQLMTIFSQEDAIYAYMSQSEEWDSSTTASLFWNTSDMGAVEDVAVETLPEGNVDVHYVVVVEATLSTGDNYGDDIADMIAFIKDQDTTDATFTVATFGQSFDIIEEDMTTLSQLKTVLSDIPYINIPLGPNLVNGVQGALAYCETYPRQGGDLLNVIFVTDNITYEDATVTAQEDYLSTMEIPAGVVVHTLGLADANDDRSSAFLETLGRFSNGVHTVFGADHDTGACATDISNYVNNLGIATFQLPSEWYDTDTSGELRLMTDNGIEAEKLFFDSVTRLEDAVPEVADVPETVEETTPDTGEETTEKEETPAVPTVTQSGGGDYIPDDVQEGPSILTIVLFSAIGLVVLVCIVVIVRLAISKGGSPKKGNSLRMMVDVVAGKCRLRKNIIYLERSLLIGSDKKCQISWQDSHINPVCAKITYHEGVVYLEVAQNAVPVYLEGMRIQTRNRLRSGETITIGAVQFRLKF